MADSNNPVEDERVIGTVLLRWLPAITAMVAALASIVVAFISWTASRSVTDKDYVALAMNILSDKSSSIPARRWAVTVLSKVSPVDIPKELASGLISGRSVLPSELDPSATRASIMNCLKPVLISDAAKPLTGAKLPPLKGAAEFKDWAVFGFTQTGQLERANLRIETLSRVIDICVRQPMNPKDNSDPE